MSIVPPSHEITISEKADGTRDVVLVFVGDGTNPHTAEILLSNIDKKCPERPLEWVQDKTSACALMQKGFYRERGKCHFVG